MCDTPAIETTCAVKSWRHDCNGNMGTSTYIADADDVGDAEDDAIADARYW